MAFPWLSTADLMYSVSFPRFSVTEFEFHDFSWIFRMRGYPVSSMIDETIVYSLILPLHLIKTWKPVAHGRAGPQAYYTIAIFRLNLSADLFRAERVSSFQSITVRTMIAVYRVTARALYSISGAVHNNCLNRTSPGADVIASSVDHLLTRQFGAWPVLVENGIRVKIVNRTHGTRGRCINVNDNQQIINYKL